jgi:hypothetical protein
MLYIVLKSFNIRIQQCKLDFKMTRELGATPSQSSFQLPTSKAVSIKRKIALTIEINTSIPELKTNDMAQSVIQYKL